MNKKISLYGLLALLFFTLNSNCTESSSNSSSESNQWSVNKILEVVLGSGGGLTTVVGALKYVGKKLKALSNSPRLNRLGSFLDFFADKLDTMNKALTNLKKFHLMEEDFAALKAALANKDFSAAKEALEKLNTKENRTTFEKVKTEISKAFNQSVDETINAEAGDKTELEKAQIKEELSEDINSKKVNEVVSEAVKQTQTDFPKVPQDFGLEINFSTEAGSFKMAFNGNLETVTKANLKIVSASIQASISLSGVKTAQKLWVEKVEKLDVDQVKDGLKKAGVNVEELKENEILKIGTEYFEYSSELGLTAQQTDDLTLDQKDNATEIDSKEFNTGAELEEAVSKEKILKRSVLKKE